MHQFYKSLIFASLLLRFTRSTVKDIDHNNGWFGGKCCHLPQSKLCRRSCVNSQSMSQLSGCRESDETMFYQCLNSAQLSRKCCSVATTVECNNACNHVFSAYINSGTIGQRQKNKFAKHCKTSDDVIECAKSIIRIDEKADNNLSKIHCCNKTTNINCGHSCTHILQTMKTNQEIMDALVTVCGLPFNIDYSPNERLWQCFLSLSKSIGPNNNKNKSKLWRSSHLTRNHNINGNSNSDTAINNKNNNNHTRNKKKTNERRQSTKLSSASAYRYGMDSAKFMCCWKAKSDTCKKLCEKTWSDQWIENWHQFDRICQYSPQETNLIQCLDDVEGLCQLGCRGLQFCDIFNDRPNQLFRKCDDKSDTAAKEDYDSWMKGVITVNVMEIPVKNVANCNPQVWKAIACSIHIKPCISHNHQNNICRSSCVNIISECIDSNRIPSTLLSAATICDLISTNDTEQCIDIEMFIQSKSSYSLALADTLINACNRNPCSPNQLCVANDNCNNENCLPFRCFTGCRLGEMSPFLVKSGSLVKIPAQDNCYYYCRCGTTGHLIDCSEYCGHNQYSDCVINANLNITHLTQLVVNDRQCICYNGGLKCIDSDCSSKCSTVLSPVCANNGQTYPNSCYAHCSGFSREQYIDGRCDLHVSCQDCAHTQRCVKKNEICLLSAECQQYECVSKPIDCLSMDNNNPVCDLLGVTHPNLCWLLMKEQQFAYDGKCLLYCSHSGPVCGVNGMTYQSECVSLSHSVPVDYYSPCNHSTSDNCADVKCPIQPKCVHNFHHHLLYNCCPICGSVAHILYLKNNNADEQSNYYYMLTVEQLAKSLRSLVKIFGCNLYSYLSYDGSIVTIVKPNVIVATEAHLRQCHQELRRIVTLINNQSPVVSLQFPLYLLVMAEMVRDDNQENHSNYCCESSLRYSSSSLVIGILIYSLNAAFQLN